MHRSTMKSALGAALFVPCLLLTACGPEAGLEMLRPPVNPEMALVPPHAPIRKGYAWNAARRKLAPVHYAEVDGLAVVEGDMIIGTVEEVEAHTREVEARGGPEAGGVQAQGVTAAGMDARWPNAVVPYTIDPALPSTSRVTDAIAAWEGATHIRFVLRTASNATEYPQYVTFTPGQGCVAAVGKGSGGQQLVTLQAECATGHTIHEIGHVLGLWHEHSRDDRDSYVRILWENIMPGYEGQFGKALNAGDDYSTYNYESIMHYPADAYSKNQQLKTIEALAGR